MKIPLDFQICDNRDSKKLNKQSFSGYKKLNVFQAFEKALFEDKIEDSLHWSIEIIASGYIEELWERLFAFVSKHINIANVEVISYIRKRYDTYLNFIRYSNIESVLQLRNHQQFRNLICEIVCVICRSRKMKLTTLKKVKKEELRSATLKQRIQATAVINGSIIKYNDPNEIKIVSNEFLYNIRNLNLQNTLFWFSWMVEWDKLNVKKLKEFKCAFRPQKNIDSKLSTDFIWLIWEIILKEARNKNINYVKEVIDLHYLFIQNYKKSKKNKRLLLVVCAIKILFFSGFSEPNIIDDYTVIIRASNTINFMYKDKKKFENAYKEAHKILKFQNVQRRDYKLQNNPYYQGQSQNQLYPQSQTQQVRVRKPKKKKKTKNISDESLTKLNLVMDMGKIIRRDEYNSSRLSNL